jgi:hypothetical protein
VPGLHARAVLERAAFAVAYALPDGSLPEICSGHDAEGDGHARHLLAPACLACVLMAAPGHAASSFLVAERPDMPVAAAPQADGFAPGRSLVWTPQSARAPPRGSSSFV